MNFTQTKLAQDDMRSLGRHAAIASRLITALRHSRLDGSEMVLCDVPPSTTTRSFDGNWYAITARVAPTAAVTLIARVDVLRGAVAGTIWAIGLAPASGLVALAKRRVQGRLTRDALSKVGLFPPFAALLDWVEVETMHRVVVHTAGRPLVAILARPARPDAWWTLVVKAGERELTRRPLPGWHLDARGDLPLLDIAAIVLAADVAQAGGPRATALCEAGVDPRERDVLTRVVHVQRTMSWLHPRLRGARVGALVPTDDLAATLNASQATADEMLRILVRARLLAADGNAYRILAVRPAPPGRPRGGSARA